MEKRGRAKATELAQTDADGVLVDGRVDADVERSVDGSAHNSNGPVGRPVEAELYSRLAAPFDVTFRDLRGGVELEYITGEQATTRLNETLGFLAWSFRVLEHGIHAEADECWVLGELTVTLDGRTVTRQQFGSQKVKRSRTSGTPLDIGFDLKGAATDALKKCASLIGVALYLWKKEPPAGLGNAGQPAGGASDAHAPSGANGIHVVGSSGAAGATDLDSLYCEECGEPLTETRFKDGTNWAPAQLAVFGRRKHSRILCMTHYREANQAKRRAEEALQQVPF
jgi:Rad52/22 family double-strand break repair protein